jgi:hypothetical protein
LMTILFPFFPNSSLSIPHWLIRVSNCPSFPLFFVSWTANNAVCDAGALPKAPLLVFLLTTQLLAKWFW